MLGRLSARQPGGIMFRLDNRPDVITDIKWVRSLDPPTKYGPVRPRPTNDSVYDFGADHSTYDRASIDRILPGVRLFGLTRDPATLSRSGVVNHTHMRN